MTTDVGEMEPDALFGPGTVAVSKGRTAVMIKDARMFFMDSSSGFRLESTLSQRHVGKILNSPRPLGVRITDSTREIRSTWRQLAAIARQAQLAKRTDVLQEASHLMLALPMPKQLRAVGLYYWALANRKLCEFHRIRETLIRVVEEAPQPFNIRALLTLGATYYDAGNTGEAIRYYLGAGKAAIDSDQVTATQAVWQMAIIRGSDGDHERALRQLEDIVPIVRGLSGRYPVLYYDLLNSLAVELGALGRLDEAWAASALPLASPYAANYTEWADTRRELAERRRSPAQVFVALAASPRRLNPQPTRFRVKARGRVPEIAPPPSTSLQISTGSPDWAPNLQTTNIPRDRSGDPHRPRAPPPSASNE